MQWPFCKETIQEGAIKCRHCGSMLNSTPQGSQPTNQQQNVNTNQPGKFNVLALLFSSAYYAGYGKTGKGIVLALIGFMPLTLIGVGIYAGLKANKELPVGNTAFSWPKAIGVSLLHSLFQIIAITVIQAAKS